jgi:hypothetical protein
MRRSLPGCAPPGLANGSRAPEKARDDALFTALVKGDRHLRVGACALARADDALPERRVRDAVSRGERALAGNVGFVDDARLASAFSLGAPGQR